MLGESLDGIEVRYDGALNPANATLTIAPKFLRKYVPGLRLPKPVRVGEGGD